jgi:ferredoxin-NADP reductase
MPPPRAKQLVATLLESKPLTEQVSWFRLRLSEPLDFAPGQYVDLRFPGEERYHAFSFAGSPARKDEVELVIKLEKEFTTRLFSSPLGTRLEALAPLGRFMANPRGDVVMIAGGVGVTPFLSMVRWARDANLQDRHYWLFYSCRTRADIFHAEELRALPAQNPNIHVVLTVTRETPPGWDGELGHIDRAMLLKHLGSLEGKSFYSCGPARLTEEMVAMLQEAGVPKEMIFTESWG